MPPVMKTTIDGIELWVRQGQQAAWDIGTSRAVIEGDEYALRAVSQLAAARNGNDRR
ncbi:MAG: hypothetical protein KatS3mg105_4975 [Gemmatales bacterium]|nr:MAG: hypothetical protein KatS3mg105_4975 [Gemmatales bacterium]